MESGIVRFLHLSDAAKWYKTGDVSDQLGTYIRLNVISGMTNRGITNMYFSFVTLLKFRSGGKRMECIETIFAYNDFREYLKRYYEEKKRNNPHFSYQSLARKAGFKNREYLFTIINGSKRLSTWRCLKLSEALGHSKREREYFVNLVGATQAENEEECEYYRLQMMKIKTEMLTETEQTRINQYEFYSTWYHTAVRAIINIFPFRDDYKQLGERLSPPITSVQAKSSVELLERLNLIKKNSDGMYQLTGRSIKDGPEISDTCKKRFLKEYTILARKAIDDHYPENCAVNSVTLTVSQHSLEYIREETEKFKKKIMECANNDALADCVYQYQIISFPLTSVTPQTVPVPV
jgi:uncharacterized protein (TIGR02147 family)